jgi:hypothetical protein
MPIKDHYGETIGVAQAINKISVIDEPFDEKDEKVNAGYSLFIRSLSGLLVRDWEGSGCTSKYYRICKYFRE